MPISDQTSSPTDAPSTLSPVLLEPVLVERIWGVQDLSPWHSAVVQGAPVGEIWLTAEDCKVSKGPLAGRSLAQVTSAAPEPFGDAQHEGFPLLIKLLFPREKLSVQVHPDDAQARALGMPRGKTECWYVLSAEPGAQVAAGFKEALTPADVRSAIQDGTLEEKLRMIPVNAGDMVFVDAGTVHAIGPGMVVLETQQYSDTTYRLWDYGRPRELHVDAGTAVTRTDTQAGLVAPVAMDGFTRLASCEYFAVDRFDLPSNTGAQLGHADKLQILIGLSGSASLETDKGEPLEVPRGAALVLPANSGAHTIRTHGAAQVIRVLQP